MAQLKGCCMGCQWGKGSKQKTDGGIHSGGQEHTVVIHFFGCAGTVVSGRGGTQTSVRPSSSHGHWMVQGGAWALDGADSPSSSHGHWMAQTARAPHMGTGWCTYGAKMRGRICTVVVVTCNNIPCNPCTPCALCTLPTPRICLQANAKAGRSAKEVESVKAQLAAALVCIPPPSPSRM